MTADAATLVGYRFPGGEYTLTRAEGERLCSLVGAPPQPPGLAHPIAAQIATNVARGLAFADFAALLGTTAEAGFLFGGGSLEYLAPLRVDHPYSVRGSIEAIERRSGRRTGPFDVVTMAFEIVDRRSGQVVVRSREANVVPRQAA